MASVLVALLALPFGVSVATCITPLAVSKLLSILSGVASFGLSIALVPAVSKHGDVVLGGVLRVDALSIVFLIATSFLYASTTVFACGYLHVAPGPSGRRYGRRFYGGLNVFCWSMLAAPLVNGLALLWVAIEITTVVSALLVAIDDTDAAAEASWKYVVLASLGLGIALFATIIMYYAGATIFGAAYNLSYTELLSAAHRFPPDVVRLAFVLAVLGYGTKMGLFPVHTWLPDAHSEAPTPVSALLSGALLTICFYAILRYFQITERTVGAAFPRHVMLTFGVASLALAALYLLSQKDLKRLLAYSSVEHMGILAIGIGFGAPVAVVGVLLHVLAHGAAKGTAFFGAGSVVRKFGTKDLTKVQGGLSVLPWSGTMLVAAVLGLSAMPPFGIFRSEFLIVQGGLASGSDAFSAVLVVLVTVAFFGLSWYASQTMLSPGPAVAGVSDKGAPALQRGEVSGWIVAAMLLGLGGLALLGVHPPAQLSHLLQQAAAELRPPR